MTTCFAEQNSRGHLWGESLVNNNTEQTVQALLQKRGAKLKALYRTEDNDGVDIHDHAYTTWYAVQEADPLKLHSFVFRVFSDKSWSTNLY